MARGIVSSKRVTFGSADKRKIVLPNVPKHIKRRKQTRLVRMARAKKRLAEVSSEMQKIGVQLLTLSSRVQPEKQAAAKKWLEQRLAVLGKRGQRLRAELKKLS